MPKYNLPVRVINFSGIFDLDKLYQGIYDWMINEGYNFEERQYKHKVPSPAGAEQHMKSWGWRNVTEYIKYVVNTYTLIRDMKDIEVIKDGKKTTLTKGMIRIEIGGYVETDWQGKYEATPFLLRIRKFMEKYILGNRDGGIITTVYADELDYKMIKLQTVIKDILDMETKANAFYDMW